MGNDDAKLQHVPGGGGDATLIDLIVSEMRKHEGLLNRLDGRGQIIAHVNSNNQSQPVQIEIVFKL